MTAYTINLFRVSIIASVLAMISAKDATADMIDKAGMKPYEVCALCHSLNGISVMSKFPKLAGQRQAYIEKQFKDFHKGKRENDGGQMVAITTEVDMANLPEIAAYFASLPNPEPQGLDEAKQNKQWQLGHDLFNKGKEGKAACISCHIPGAIKTGDYLAPKLKAQHQDYLLKQMIDFSTGARSNDPRAVMRAVTTDLTKPEMEALALYLATSKRSQ